MSMYLDHFGLREAPFRITPHTDFFFDGANRGATLEAMLYAVTHDEGIVKVTGEVGSGKTMLCRMLLERLPEQIETVYLANPSLTRDELLFALADELQLPSAPQRIHLLLRELQRHLIDLYSGGKQVVVLIDEAHAMPIETLEEIRLLSNLESRQHKLLQIVLFGQPELNEVLSAQNMRQLRERVTHNFNLEPLEPADIGTYLMFRMRAAGYHGPDLFTPAALKLFARSSQGLTRRLNILADKALLSAFATNTHQVDTAEANAAIKDAKFEDIAPAASRTTRRRAPGWLGAAGGALAAAAIFGGWLAWSPGRGPDEGSAQGGSIAQAPAASQAMPMPATAPTVTTTNQGGAALPATSTPADPNAAPALRLDTQPGILAPMSNVDALRQSFDRWITRVDDRHHVIQLLRVPADSRKAIETLLDEDFSALERASLRIYEARSGSQRWLGVVYGDFASLSEAEATLKNLPAQVSRHQPFIRPVHQLKQ
jgi:type II secretory pathway predicted ATPase ExeA